MLKQTSYLLHFSALRVELLPSQREGEESEQPDTSAAEALRLLPEAGSSTHREVAPEETAYMTASLCSLLPQFIRV
ncbi:hypothetical protein VZT92_000633 [Zoarces viviparus]|uniref:Uncharacterized protein n=1 Tax=Zoarces viviparus TaxID=48416 RepID=A0AAW1G7P9_ZOAVI